MVRIERLAPAGAGGAAAALGRAHALARRARRRQRPRRRRAARGAARGGRVARDRRRRARGATASATRCCARSSTTTCCRASTPSCTSRLRARSSAASTTGRGARSSPPASPTTTSRPATSRAALVASLRAADAAERVHAHGEAARCSSARSTSGRACPTPRRSPACDRASCCAAPAARCSTTATTCARRGAARAALERGRRDARPAPRRRAAERPRGALVARQGRTPRARRSTARSALLPDDDHEPRARADPRLRTPSRGCCRAATASASPVARAGDRRRAGTPTTRSRSAARSTRWASR